MSGVLVSGGAGKLRRGGDTADHSWGGTEGATGGQPPKPAPMLWLTLLPSADCLTEDAHQLHNFKTTVSLMYKLFGRTGKLGGSCKVCSATPADLRRHSSSWYSLSHTAHDQRPRDLEHRNQPAFVRSLPFLDDNQDVSPAGPASQCQNRCPRDDKDLGSR